MSPVNAMTSTTAMPNTTTKPPSIELDEETMRSRKERDRGKKRRRTSTKAFAIEAFHDQNRSEKGKLLGKTD